ncbi:MAG: GIY-YIG nuclease family protein [Smithella sp.]|jgi:homoserine kinase type II
MNIKAKQKSKVWVVYILRCSDDSLYTGMTNNIEKRFAAHTQGKAAKYTRSRPPVKLLTMSAKMDRSDAMRLEIKIKKLPRAKKIAALEKNSGRDGRRMKADIGLLPRIRSRAGLHKVPLAMIEKLMGNLICQECPNGCNLALEWEDAENVFIAGNKCASGIVYAARVIRKNKKARIHAREKTPLFSRETLKAVAELWQVCLKKLHNNIHVQGSPERSVFRVALEDNCGSFFVLEQLPAKDFEHKRQIAATLDFLAKKNLSRIQPYLAGEKGEFIIKYKNNFWQMIPFVRGVPLDRQKYMYEKWRGPVLADFLIELRRKSRSLPFFDSREVFSLKDYVHKLIREINLYNKDIKAEIKNIESFLEKDFMSAYEKLPVAFCHGDYHPLNIIWSANDIKCVIDWEFSGYKREIYDAANLIGCVGVEDPQGLTGDLVKSFIADMKSAKIISKISWRYLVEFIVALRFAWLSEWLHRCDTEMIRLELDYMRLLIDNKNSLQKAWP